MGEQTNPMLCPSNALFLRDPDYRGEVGTGVSLDMAVGCSSLSACLYLTSKINVLASPGGGLLKCRFQSRSFWGRAEMPHD